MKINLRMPRGWRECSAEQLECICKVQQQVLGVEADGQKSAWKVGCFLALAGLEIVDEVRTDEEGERYVTVRRVGEKAAQRKGEEEDGFHLYMWQVQNWIAEQLAWLDAPPSIVKFPYPEWTVGKRVFRGPSVWLSGWTWQQYRLLKDYLDYFFKVEEMARVRPTKELDKRLQEGMAMVLATLYDGEVDYLDDTTRMSAHGYRYKPSQTMDNKECFMDFPPLRFAVVMLWWTSVAMKLQRDYPKCFASDKKEGKKKRQKAQDPTYEYARTTATLEKYMGVNEQELQQESYTVVLQHLQDMVKQNEEMERVNRRMKSKK